MKICITSSGDTLESPVDQRFGRAPKFIIVDSETGQFEVIDNKQILNIPQGAGVQAGETIAGAGVEALITGHIGPNAFKILSVAGIKIYTGAKGTVKDALAAFGNEELKMVSDPDVEGHW